MEELARGPRQALMSGGADRSMDSIWRLEWAESWRFLRRQPASFWLACTYLFFEYVRPQAIYPVIDVLPWAQTAILGALAAVFLEGKKPRLSTPITGGVLAFLVVVALSCSVAWNPALAWSEFERIVSWVVIYIMVINTVTTERRYLAFLALFLLSSLKMSQTATRVWVLRGFSFQEWGVAGAPGFFTNSGEFGIQMCVFLPLSLYFILAVRPHISPWKYRVACLMPITAVCAMIASSSRGALVGGALVGAWMVARTRYRVRAAVGLAATLLVVAVMTPPQQKARLSASGEDATSLHRLTMWKYGIEMVQDRPLLGVGYHNFPYYLEAHQRGDVWGSRLPHNIFVEAWAELGYVGLLTFLGLIGLTFVVNGRTRRLADRLGERGRFLKCSAYGLDGALVGYIGSGFFVTVLYYPYFWINLAMTASLHIAAKDTWRKELRRASHSSAAGPVGLPGFQRVRDRTSATGMEA